MNAVIDPAADDIWDSVASTISLAGTQEQQPRSDEEWQTVRRRAITLAEATNLLVMGGRRATKRYVAAEATGVLDSIGVQAKIDTSPAAFAVYAQRLHEAALLALDAIDAKDPKALLQAGGKIDAACEQCHQTYWYPDQRIPSPGR